MSSDPLDSDRAERCMLPRNQHQWHLDLLESVQEGQRRLWRIAKCIKMQQVPVVVECFDKSKIFTSHLWQLMFWIVSIYIYIFIYYNIYIYNYIYICFSCFIPSSLKEVGPSRRLMRAISIASPGRSRWSRHGVHLFHLHSEQSHYARVRKTPKVIIWYHCII